MYLRCMGRGMHWVKSSLSSQPPNPHSLYCIARDVLVEEHALAPGTGWASPPPTLQTRPELPTSHIAGPPTEHSPPARNKLMSGASLFSIESKVITAR